MRRGRMHTGSRYGFTLIEVVIALVLIGLVLANVGMVVRSSAAAYQVRSSLSHLDSQADTTLDRIALALMGSSPETFLPASEGAWTKEVEYQKNLGVQDGQPVWSDPEKIEGVLEKEQIVWTQNPEEIGERSVVWTNWVREFLEGEVANGEDDNGNGLIDEAGLALSFLDRSVDIRLTLYHPGPGDQTLTRTVETRVTCRN